MSDPHWLDSEQQRHWRTFLMGAWSLFNGLERDLEEATGLSMNEYEVLVRLSEAPEQVLRMSALADQVVASRSRLTHTIRRMEAEGLVSRRRCPDDRRGVECLLTEEGMATLEAAAPQHVASVRARLVDVVSAEEFATLGNIFDQVLGRISR